MKLIDKFQLRHIGPRPEEIGPMLDKIGVGSINELMDQAVPKSIRSRKPLNLSAPMSEQQYAEYVSKIARKNKVYRSFIGMGYYETVMPAVIRRNILENPGWYTSYTPYQAEISQGRLEALLNFQTVVSELTALPIANASLLDEATAASEAMIMMHSKRARKFKKGGDKLFVDEDVFPQTKAVLETKAEPLGIEIEYGKFDETELDDQTFGAIVQYPAASGQVNDYRKFAEKAKANETMLAVAADILALAILVPPGEWGADIAFGNTQRFGVPMGYGGPHAAYFATTEKLKRALPGRIIGVSKDRHENPALRMALQTREQHIKRERATSNICTAQALLATMAGMYAVYHGPQGLKNTAQHVHSMAATLEQQLVKIGYKQLNVGYFDTLYIELPDNIKSCDIQSLALSKEMNFFYYDAHHVGIAINETTDIKDVMDILDVFARVANKEVEPQVIEVEQNRFEPELFRTSKYLQEPVFNSYHSETEMMRYIKRLEKRDIALNHSMISLGSCTMKLNPANSMFAITWPEFANMHPFAPADQAEGYKELIDELERDLAEITGFEACSLQPNSGAAGEYTGLMVIREYHKDKGNHDRNVVIIPSSAHGTNPASGVMAGMKVVVVDCDENGNVDVDDLKAKAEEHKDTLAAFMITYPSTHGVFESRIREMNQIIHDNGGLVYMDGANMNAQVGLTSPGIIGADVCHLNLHKTFAIPHGGGGPGVGPICVNEKLMPYLPSNPVLKTGGEKPLKAVAAAPYGSASVLPITHAYLKMLGAEGLLEVTKMSIVNANYLVAALKGYYDVLYTGETGRCAHEMILECRNFRQEYGVDATDIAKRLIDYGFHAPTLSFPVHDTLMVEPTESESVQELDRFSEAMISIKKEMEDIKNGKADKEDNLLKMAPHTAEEVTADEWAHPYKRSEAAYPLEWIRINKFWPHIARVDDGYGDRNLVCTCAPISEYQ
ncbi:Glycine dehydrogenase (decarboxylating) [Salinivirga cyanobacteriivorans]|uniref:Glycine dehydrogenase (decarboxylating) n=1 Tax=Salinivirga cyanobacteriivorans TaxID=1307839 RepID=A0A0S2I4J3_9BACT|nr:aminomethyl-transferring glycine dehydrogenase [Salinivirga cyanobacteriivorans]ALO17109.1 Glycine dehydrogenase (decarboxylating) [Salinivirga cyanobacteriivorans]